MKLSILLLAGASATAVNALSWPFAAKTVAIAAAKPRALRAMTVAELERAIALDESGLDPDTIPLPVEEFPFATAAPVVVVAPFTGTQYTVGILKIRPSELRREAAVFVLLLAYLALSLYGKQHARQEATRWFTTAKPLLDSEFSSLGLSKDESLIQDGGDKFVGFATGRRGVESATIIVQTVAYHDIFKIAYHFIREIADPNYRSGANTITLDFLLRDPVGTPGAKFVFAVASKLGLQALRTTRYDLTEFTTLSESSALPSSLVILAETPEIASSMLNPTVKLAAPFASTEPGFEYFKSLIISDMPTEKPEEPEVDEKAKKPVFPLPPKKPTPSGPFHLVLTLELPRAGEEATVQRFITLAMNLVDVVCTRPKAVSALELYKLRKARGSTEAVEVAPAPTYFEEKKLGKQSKEDEAQRRASADAAFALMKTVKSKNGSSEGKVSKKQK